MASTSSLIRSLLLFGLCAGAVGVPALAAIVPGTSTRQLAVSADIGGGVGSLTDSAPGAGLYDQQLELPLQAGGLPLGATGFARQTSEFGAASIVAAGAARATLALPGATAVPPSASASGDSQFILEFTLDAASSYTLLGAVNTLALVTGGASVPTLSNLIRFESLSGGTTLFETLTDDESFSLSGLLAPGVYRFTASAAVQAAQTGGAVARTVSGESTFDFSFTAVPDGGTVPAPSVPALLAAAALAGWWARGRRSP